MLKKAYRILQAARFPKRKIKLEFVNEFLSYTNEMYDIHLGYYATIEYWLGIEITHTLIHEIIHSYVKEFPPTSKQKKPFGSTADWKKPQRMHQWIWGSGSTRYGSTHPDEDFVETITCILLNEPNNATPSKLQAANSWMGYVKNQERPTV